MYLDPFLMMSNGMATNAPSVKRSSILDSLSHLILWPCTALPGFQTHLSQYGIGVMFASTYTLYMHMYKLGDFVTVTQHSSSPEVEHEKISNK